MASEHATPIQVPFPAAESLRLQIGAGACRFEARPGADEPWVAGTYVDPTGARPLRLWQEGGTVRLAEGHQSFENVAALFNGVPRYDIALGRARPYSLTLETGASEFVADLGGLPLTHLAIKQGAGKYDVDFSAPNPQAMRLLSLGAGAGAIELRHLANANFGELVLEGGVASFQLDFGGELRRDALVRVTAALSSVVVRLPRATAAQVNCTSVVGDLDIGDGFTKRGDTFWNEAALAGGGPVLTVRANVTFGSFQVHQY
ncbi:MAG: DUF4097 family beta strand repeat-containing protein [Chloroflexota bacterium]